MISGITDSGFNFTVNEESLDDYELMESLAELDDGNILKIPDVVNRLLGREQAKALKKHCRNNGRVKTTDISNEIFDIFGKIKDGKKS